MKRFYVVIYNSTAGRSRAGVLARIERYFDGRGLPHVSSDIDHCDFDLVRARIADHDEVRFVVAGGDGTLRLTLERLWHAGLLKSCPVAFVPLGSANVAALSFGLPLGLDAALRKAVEGTPRPVDLGLLNGANVFFIAAIFGAVSSITVNTHRGLKKRFGGLAYLMCLDRLLRMDYRKAFRLTYEEGGRSHEIESHSMIVCNHLNVGALRPSRQISADDAQLDLITLHNTRFWGLATAAWEFFRGKRDSRVLRHRRFREAIYKLKGFTGRVHLDGDECVDLSNTVDVKVLPSAARFVA